MIAKVLLVEFPRAAAEQLDAHELEFLAAAVGMAADARELRVYRWEWRRELMHKLARMYKSATGGPARYAAGGADEAQIVFDFRRRRGLS